MSANQTPDEGIALTSQEKIDDKLIDKTVISLVDEPVEELNRKANMLNLGEKMPPVNNSQAAVNSVKFKNNYHHNRKPYNNNYNINLSTNRSYQVPYSAYPYSIINSAAIMPNSSIQMIPPPYIYSSNYTANMPNSVYAPRHSSQYSMNNFPKRTYVI